MRTALTYVLLMTALLSVAGTAKAAVLIDFEAQGTSAPSTFNGTLNSPLMIGIATFAGGQLLNHEVSAADQTAVYATTNVFSGYADPLTINFSTAVSGFSIDITNEFADSYTVADNFLHSQTAALAANTTDLVTLTDSGITSVTIASATSSLWDFAIDNVQFTPQAAAVPEPSSLLFLAPACAAIATLARRKSL